MPSNARHLFHKCCSGMLSSEHNLGRASVFVGGFFFEDVHQTCHRVLHCLPISLMVTGGLPHLGRSSGKMMASVRLFPGGFVGCS
jgi:hypothetical protein